MLLDRKYNGVIAKNDGTIVQDAIVFRAKDKLVPDMLLHYKELCIKAGCNTLHIDEITALYRRVITYQHQQSDLVKVPDTMDTDLAWP